jgi:hypothetical protein
VEAAKPAAPETSSAEPPMKTATVKSPAAPGNRLVVGHHQDPSKIETPIFASRLLP